MSTNSCIAIKHKDSYRYSYCHWDGYPEYVGAILKKHYTTEEKVDELLDHGSISSLGIEIGDDHDFEDRPTNSDGFATACTFYHRDRGEDLKLGSAASAEGIGKEFGGVEWIYIFDPETKEWTVRRN